MIKNKNTVIAMTVMVVSIVIFIFSFYVYGMSSVSNDTTGIDVTIEAGSIWSVATTLKENNLIRSKLWFYFYCRASDNTNLMAATYTFNRSMDVKEIVSKLASGSSKNINSEEITITFPEGKNIRNIANIIEKNTNNSTNDVYTLLENKDYIENLISQYWFLTDDILNSNIYYPLEGYLYPETYNFKNKDVSVSDIFDIMLKQTDKELSKYKDEIDKSSLSIHEIITLSSIVELEAKNSDDRKAVAGVFFNRLNANMTLGSDVTTYYASKIDNWSESLTTEQLNDCNNLYNTRCSTNKGFPVGPIANASHDSIEAVLNPDKNSYYYFVADCQGNTYFSKTDTGNINNKQKLINENNWCG